jgi:hypothetical protein
MDQWHHGDKARYNVEQGRRATIAELRKTASRF